MALSAKKNTSICCQPNLPPHTHTHNQHRTCRGVDKVWLAAPARHKVRQHLGVVLQGLAVDEVAHLVHRELAALKLKGELGDGLRRGLAAGLAQAVEVGVRQRLLGRRPLRGSKASRRRRSLSAPLSALGK